MGRVLPFEIFVRRQHLTFNLAALIQQSIESWSRVCRLPEGCADAIVDELDQCRLRRFAADDAEALFNRLGTQSEYRACIDAALHRLVHGPRTPGTERRASYYRPCGE